MKRKRRVTSLPKRETRQIVQQISPGNLSDLISPFLYQVGLVKHSEEVENLLIHIKSGKYYLSCDLKKKGGVEHSKELQEGDHV